MLAATRMLLANTMTAPAARVARRNRDKAFDKITDRVHKEFGIDLTDADADAVAQLGVVTRALAGIPGLSGVGWMSVQTMMTRRLRTRYRVRQLHHEHPDIAHETIEAPIFVLGLPRTATTLTHKILANADGCRGPMLWEMYHPDLPQSDKVEARWRAKTQKEMDQVLGLSPNWNRIHPVRAGWPEEIFFLLTTMRFHTTIGPMPEYVEYVKTQDPTADYEFVRQVMQVLQYRRPGPRPRWVLKHPGCMEDLSTIMKVFPDATIVWTHRDPHTVVGSLCSMVESIQRLHRTRGSIDLNQIGHEWLAYTAEMVQTARDQRVKLPREPFIDLSYHTLMSDPGRYVPELFDQLGLKWDAPDEQNLADALDRPRDRRGHEYALSHYGIGPDQVDKAFGDYHQFINGLSK